MRLPVDVAIGAPEAQPEAKELAAKLKAALQQAKLNISQAQAKQSKDSAAGRRAGTVQAGDLVMLSTEHLALYGQGRTRKLGDKYVGPFKVLEMRGTNAVKLQLPQQ